jgi:hypothetical protein
MGKTTLSPKKLGLSLGILWAVGVLLISLGAGQFSWWMMWAELLADAYPWAGTDAVGLLAGTVWAFVDGFVGGWVIAWLYNKMPK